MVKILRTITEKEKKLDNYHLGIFAYDKEINTLVLLEELTQNMNESNCGLTWLEIYQDLELNESFGLFDNLETGIYKIEFIAWGWQEPDTEAGYGDGDAGSELLSYEKIEYSLSTQ